MIRRLILSLLFTLASLLPCQVYASLADIRVLDETKSGFGDVLVIVQSLPNKNEIFRALTETNGNVPRHDLKPGLYRIIATCPYGPCVTVVREILVSQEIVKIDLIVKFKPIVNDFTIYDSGSHLRIKVLEANGSVSQGARIIVRDEFALEEHWYSTDINGVAIIGIAAGETSIIVVVTSNQLEAQTLLNDEIRNLQKKHTQLAIKLNANSINEDVK